ncbi:MAG TPA: hypothetical protein VE995_04885 [Gaiellaceae bacterium]|nr:hypothetical protein [Gaiellaceae bacterium]
MEIGKPRRIHHVEPVKSPVPRREPERAPAPERREPVREPATPAR